MTIQMNELHDINIHDTFMVKWGAPNLGQGQLGRLLCLNDSMWYGISRLKECINNINVQVGAINDGT
jgi:hypothetical protein